MSVQLYNETFQSASKLILDYRKTLEEHLESPHRWLKGAAIIRIKEVDRVLMELKQQRDKSLLMEELKNG